MGKSANVSKNFVAGRMNKSVDERLVPDGEYVNAVNIRLGSTEISEIGSVENAKGNEQLTTLTYIDAANTPLNAGRCIGVYADVSNHTLYWFVKDDAFVLSGVTRNLDMIVSYNTFSNSLTYHVISISANTSTPTTLNFSNLHLITGVNLVNDMLFWTDDYNPPRKINVTKNYPYPTQPGDVDQITAEEFLVIKKPPAESPVVTTYNTTGDESFMEGRFICFATRYKYEDGEYSATSQFSNPAFIPSSFQFSPDTYLNQGMLNSINAANLEVNSGGPLVKGVDILFKEAESSIIKIIDKIDKAEEGWIDSTVYTYYFDNSKIFTILPESEILRLFDNVPKLAKAQTIMGNRLVYGNYTEGYDLINKDGVGIILSDHYTTELVSTDMEEIDLETALSSYTYTIDTSSLAVPDAQLKIETTNLELKQGTVLIIGVTLKHYGWTGSLNGGVTMLTTNNDIVLEFSYTLPQDYASGYDLATSVPFAAFLGSATVSNPIGNPCPASSPTISDRLVCSTSVTLTTVAGGCPAPQCTVVDVVNRYQSGVTFDGEGILVGADPTLPDEFNLLFPAIKYIDNAVAGTPPAAVTPALPYVPTYYQYEYFNLENPEVTFRSVTIPKSLHSNRGYEVGIVYMDEFNRSTNALVSESNTVHVPCRNSISQNQIKVTIPVGAIAPEWATRYKFVVKPDEKDYNTIYSNIVFTDSANPLSKYVLLEGENTRKVNEGDELIVKTDTAGAISQCLTVTALEVKAQEADFITPITGSAFAGTYMKLNSNNFNATIDPCDIVLKGKKCDTTPKGLQYPKVIYPFYTACPSGGADANIDLPANSKVRMKLFFERRGSGDGEKACERREWEKDITFTVSQDYANAFDWWQGDNVAASLEDPDYEYVGGSGCSISNVYQNNAPNPTNNLSDINTALCTNYFRWYEDGGGLLSLMVTGTESCASAKHSDRRKSEVCVTFEIYKANSILAFETKPADALPDLWYEGEASYPIDTANGYHLGNTTRYDTNQSQTAVLPAIITLQFFNCFTFGNGIESYRIQDSMVGKYFTLGNRAYATASKDLSEADRFADLTYSGVINDESNINKLNEFNLGLLNFKALEDSFGEVMRIDGRATDILVLQEHKISYVLTEKDLLSDASGGGALTSTPQVLGTQIARQEEYGISRNPESYVQYGYDKYFTDVKRGAVIQLRGTSHSNEELIVVSEQGMRSFFRDEFIYHVNTQKLGGYDPYMNEYVLSMNTRALPSSPIEIECGMQFSVDTSLSFFFYTVELGTTVGDVDIVYNPVVASGQFLVQASYSGVVFSTGPVDVGGTLTFNKASAYPTTMDLAVVQVGAAPHPVVDITPGCPQPTTLNLVQVCLTNDYEALQTVHNQTQYQDGAYYSPLLVANSGAPTIFSAGTGTPLVSQYTVTSGPQGFGAIPIENSTVYLYASRINADTFQFSPTGTTIDRLRALRTNTLYNNTPADMISLLNASNILAVTPGTGGETQYSANISFGAAPYNTGDYLYLIYDYRDLVPIELCYTASSGTPATDVHQACCLCDDCGAGACTEYSINLASGPACYIQFVNCLGGIVQSTLSPGGKLTICCFPETTFTVVQINPGDVTQVTYTVTDCNC